LLLSAPSPPAARVNEEGKVLYACPEVRDLCLVGDVPSRIPTCHMGQFHCRVHGAHIILESIMEKKKQEFCSLTQGKSTVLAS
jgi:hypothetical protein